MSLEIGGGPGKLDEDCLGLNVFGPRVERTAQLPVMVWIHGAALIFGSNGIVPVQPVFDEIGWVKRNLDALFVMSTAVGVDDLLATDFIKAPWTSVSSV